MFSALLAIFRRESTAGLVLMFAAALAVVVANSSWSAGADQIFQETVRQAIDDGLMAIFFLLVSLEIKRELVLGDLSSLRQVALPGVAALGGMVVPALIYLAFNNGNLQTRVGWAIPSATDIAFSLGVLRLLGGRAPTSLRVFLTALAILDDLGAILIIAVFYSHDLSLPFLAGAAVLVGVLVGFNRRGASKWYFAVAGIALWACLLRSGIHATLAGVAVGLAVPVNRAEKWQHVLHPWVSFAVLPLFAFANARLRVPDLSLSMLADPVLLGVALGLLIGKPVGVFGASWLMVRLKAANLPVDVTWRVFFGATVLAGIGFTMSLFIGGLAFPHGGEMEVVRFGVLTGSLLAALTGASIIVMARR